MVGSVPFWRSSIFPKLIADVLDAAEDRKYLAAGATVLGTELAGEALSITKTPVDDQPGEAFAIDGPTPRSPDRARFAIVGTMGRRFASWLVVTGREQNLTAIGRLDVRDQQFTDGPIKILQGVRAGNRVILQVKG